MILRAALAQTRGHHPDGSSIQKHSAGSHYPFVVRIQEVHELTKPDVTGALAGYGYADVMAPDGSLVDSFVWRLDGDPEQVKVRRLWAYEQAYGKAELLAQGVTQ